MKRPVVILLLAVGLLTALGALALLSSFGGQPKIERLYAQLLWIATGLVCLTGGAFLPWEVLRRWWFPEASLLVAILLLVAVYLPGVGVMHNGARRWLAFGQPSEFAKLAIVIFLADYAARRRTTMGRRFEGFLAPGFVVALVTALIFFEEDWGTACLLGLVSFAMLALAGTHWFYLGSTLVIAVEAFLLRLLSNPLRMDRVMAFLEPEHYRDGTGWQAWQALLALGRGGWTGVFFGEGLQKNGFVPEQQTDFVLSLIGEELGFMGTLLVLVLFAAIFLCGIRIAWRVTDPFSQFLALGISLLIAAQALLNIAVVSSALPNKGIALPFVSYGGSSLIGMLVAVGLLVGVARQADRANGTASVPA